MKKFSKYICFLLISIHVCSVSSGKFSIFGNYLYWVASEESGAVWANAVADKVDMLKYTLPNIKFNWSSGFRAGLLYESPRLLATRFYWTHFATDSNVSYVASPFEVLVPQFISGNLSGDNFFSSANINWKIVINSINFVVSHQFSVVKSFSISPSIGVKGAIIDQTANSYWNYAPFSIPVFTSTETVINDFSGLGPTIGIDAKWKIYHHFSLVGNFSTALMWGSWHVKDTYIRPSSSLRPSTTITTTSNSPNLGTVEFQYFLGIGWEHHGRFPVHFILGYEGQFWANQLRVPTFQLLPLHSDLTLQGATCSISIDL